MPELVSVPFLAALSNKKLSRSKSMNSRFPLPTGFNPIALREPDSPAVESYRALCNIILLSAAQNSMKMLIVTSATPGEGKSTVSCNLATALAQRGRKVLMVDADLRSCSSNSQTGTSTQSLTTLCQTGNLDHPQYRPIPILPTLHVLPAGIRSANPTGVLDSVRMQELMAAWRAEYDHIIIDTPPVLLFADALVLAARADAIVMVTRADVSRRPEVLRARDLLERAGGNILGFVLNAVRSPQYYYGYPSSYGPQYAPVKTDPEKTKTVLGGS
jgi:capsular exopolysaccharide synthesis family protein